MALFLRKPSRQGSANGLSVIAVLGGVVSIILAIVLLISGTTSVHRSGDGGDEVLLKDLALVSFDGIIPSNETYEFLVHVYWFVGSFAWEYPTAPEGIPKVGFTSTGPRFFSNIVSDLQNIALKLDLPRNEWDCPRPGPYAPSCDNIFYEAWRSFATEKGILLGSWITWFMSIAAILLTTMAISHEWMIRYRPYWMRCRCWILKRYCPCPKGTKEEIEKTDDHVWDKIRVSYWGLVAGYFILPASHATFGSIFLVKFIGYFDDRLPEELSMNARRRTTGSMLLWGAAVLSTVSFLCMLGRWVLSRRPKGWMEEQSLGQLGDALERDHEPALHSRTESGRYTDE
ncbi:Fc.00g020020.m01.CDS01 [Cosmosporella sp. VM-42]